MKTESGEEVVLEDLMIFFSGARKEPPLGLTPKPTVSFIDGNLAKASTCTYRLLLPYSHADFQTFKLYMILSLKGHSGFGLP